MRRPLAVLCFVLACVLAPVALGSWWVYGLATDTAQFDRAASPLADDDEVQAAVVDELVRVGDARLDGLANPAAARSQLRAATNALVRTAAYRGAWRAVQRSAHARLAVRLTGDVTTPLTLDLAPVAEVLRARLAQSAVLAPVAGAVADPQPVVLLDHDEVRRARGATSAIHVARGIAIPGAVLALLGALLTAASLAAGLVRAGLAVGIAAAIVLGGDASARASISSGGEAGGLRLAVYDVLTDGLHSWVIGGAIAAVALIAAGAAISALAPSGDRARRA